MPMKYVSLSICIFIALTSFAQNNFPVSLYAHNNQTIYHKGEQVFSKIYLRTPQGLHMKPLNIYVDWYHANGSLLAHQTYLTAFGGAEAGFLIPVNYDSQYIRMRMYTMHSLKQIPDNQFFDQVVFVHQPAGSKQITLKNNEINPLSKSTEDEFLQITNVTQSFSPKGRSEWIFENLSKDFINLSLSIMEEESFEASPYTILTHFKKPTPNELLIKPDYYDAFVQVKGKLIADSNLLNNAILSFSIFKQGQLPIIDKVPINRNGTFLIDQLNIVDSVKLSVQVDYKGNRKEKIPLSYQQLGLFNSAPLYAFDFKDSIPAFRYTRIVSPYIPYKEPKDNEVVVYTNTKAELEVLEKKYTSGMFRGGDAVSFNAMTPIAQSHRTIFHYLQGKVPGLQIIFENQGVMTPNTDEDDRLKLVGNDASGLPRFSWRSQFDQIKLFLNQVPIDIAGLMQINIAEIAFVKVFRPPFLGAALGAPNGAIVIYTKLGDEENFSPRDSKLTSFTIKGYTSFTPYTQPDYSSELNRAVIDMRKTLLWAPTIHLNHDKPKMTFVYYNNDRSKKHRLIVEGVKQNGEVIRRDWLIE